MSFSNCILTDSECTHFLQWALPSLNMRWPGFRRVRGQVCKRLKRRIVELGLADINDYRQYLISHRQEWQQLDSICRVTVSRFNRDRVVFQHLFNTIIPEYIVPQLTKSESSLRVWSAGCASGEEPYTLMLYWRFVLAARFPQLKMQILATDINEHLLQRAKQACYSFGSIKRLPDFWRAQTFVQKGEQYCLDSSYQEEIEFRIHDIRQPLLEKPFDIILCRNLAFTYYDDALKNEVLVSLGNLLKPGAFLVLGAHESLGAEVQGFSAFVKHLGIYQKDM